MGQNFETYDLDGPKALKTDVPASGEADASETLDALSNQAARYQESIDKNLVLFQGQLTRLKAAIENQIAKIDRGEIADADFGTIIKRVDPLMLTSIQQETKIHEKLAERAGRAGQQAINFRDAEFEIGRRLACLRRPDGDGEIRGDAS
ncbi:MAG: hypothetical protein AAF340_01695 [Pseudomonadota bacterium]